MHRVIMILQEQMNGSLALSLPIGLTLVAGLMSGNCMLPMKFVAPGSGRTSGWFSA